MRKGQKAASFYFAPEKLQNHAGEGKGKEKKKERKEGKKLGDEKKAMVGTLIVFIMATVEMVFSRKKKLFDGRGLFGC